MNACRILKIASEEANRARRRGMVWLSVEDAAQEGALAVIAACGAKDDLDWALVRVVARRRIFTAHRNEAVRRTAKTGAHYSTQAGKTFKVQYTAPGFLAFDSSYDEDEAGPPILAHNPEPFLVDAIAARTLVTKRQTALTLQTEAGNAPAAASSRQAQHARLQRDVAWAKANARPFDFV